MRRLLRRLPLGIRRPLQRLRIFLRSARYRLRERVRPVVVTQAEVEDALRAAGVQPGDTLFVQTQMSSFGTFEDGPRTVMDALEAVRGPGSTLVMPSFPMRGLSYVHVRENPAFDSRTEPSRMGAVTELFRNRPGVARSLHPTHPLLVDGPGAEEFVAGHEHAETPFGDDTPFGELTRRGAKNVLMGTSVRPLTAYHAFEAQRPFPYSVFCPDREPVTVIGPDGTRTDVTTLVHRPQLAPGRLDFNPSREALVKERLLAGGMRRVPLGRSEILCQEIPAMFETFEKMLADDETIYEPYALEGLRLS